MLGFNLPENINIQYYVNDEPIDFICLNEIGTYTIRAEISGDYANFELLAPNELQVQIKEKSKTLIYVLIAFGSIGLIYVGFISIRRVKPKKLLK